jgi:hypothetical protein
MKPAYVNVKLMGMVQDIPPEELPNDVFSDGNNIRFKDQAAERTDGYAAWGGSMPVGADPVYLLPVLTATTAYWIYCTIDEIYVTDGSTHWDITPAAGIATVEPYNWSGVVLNGVPVLNNGSDAPIYWDLNTSNPMVDLPGWPATWKCKTITASQYHLFALSITKNSVEYPDLVHWSEAAEPGALPQEWDPTAANDAGSFQLSETPGEVLDGAMLRGNLILYKRHSTYIADYVGGTFIFNKRLLFATAGIQAAGCVAEYEGKHYVFTQDDVLVHDGNQPSSIVNWRVKNEIVENINPAAQELCVVAARHSANEIWICFPSGQNTKLDTAYIYNLKTGDIGRRALNDVSHVARGVVPYLGQSNTWASDTEQWDEDSTVWNQANYSATADSLLLADTDNELIYHVGAGDDEAGADIVAYVERIGLHLQPDEKEMFWTHLYPRITGEAGDVVRVRVGGQRHFDDAVTWNGYHNFTIGTSKYIPVQLNYRYLAVRLESTGGKVWKLHGLTFGGSPQGLW